MQDGGGQPWRPEGMDLNDAEGLFYQPDYLLPHRRAAWLIGAELLTDAAARAASEMQRDRRFEPAVSALRSHAEALREKAV
jgi:hypothetical protein